MVKTRNGTSTIDDAASPLRTPRPHPRSRACLKTNTTDEEGSHEQLRRSTRLVPPRSDSERDSNDDNETLDDNNGPQNDDAHGTMPMAAQAPDKSSARKVQTNKSQGGSDINNHINTNDLESAAPATFASVTKRGPPRGLPKDGIVNTISPDQQKMTSVLSVNGAPPAVSVSNNLT
jgi:hypothetical protein